MATARDSAESNDSVSDVLITEEDVLAFFLSRSGEVRNSELVAHFRSALKKSRHRNTNRQQFPRFINHLATVRVDDDGRKTLTLKEKFQRREEPVASASEDSSNGDVVEHSAAVAAPEAASEPAVQDHHQTDSSEQAESQATDGEVVGLNEDDASGTGKDPNREEDDDESSKKLDVVSGDDGKDETSANHEVQTLRHDDESSCTSGSNVDETTTATANDETSTGDDISHSDAGMSSVPETGTESAEKSLLESESSDSSHVEETQPADSETTNGDDVDVERPNVASARKRKIKETEEKTSSAAEDQSSTGETSSAPQSADEVDSQDFQGVRKLAQRIDEAASKRASTVVWRTNKQVRASEPGKRATMRPQSATATQYDFTMNDTQREWTLRASSSDYQALAKLLSRNSGIKCCVKFCRRRPISK